MSLFEISCLNMRQIRDIKYLSAEYYYVFMKESVRFDLGHYHSKFFGVIFFD